MSAWVRTTCTDPRGRELADRHYPRIGRPPRRNPRFVAPGLPLVLITPEGDAVWATLLQRFVKHRWPGAWLNSLFRNESRDRHRSSDLILAAVAETIDAWGPLPKQGLITFVDTEATARRRSRRALPGKCYRDAGFEQLAVIPPGHGRPEHVVLRLGGGA